MKIVKAKDVKIGDVIEFMWDADPGNPEVGPDPNICTSPYPVAEISIYRTADQQELVSFFTAYGVAGLPDDQRIGHAFPKDQDIEVLEPEDMGECVFCGQQLDMEGHCSIHG